MVSINGIIRNMDALGRIVIPAEMRETREIKEKDSLQIFVDDDSNKIVLIKYTLGCLFCGNRGDLIYHKGQKICGSCIKDISAQFVFD